jgi:hypothetical protein
MKESYVCEFTFIIFSIFFNLRFNEFFSLLLLQVSNHAAIYDTVRRYVGKMQEAKSIGELDIEFRTGFLNRLIKADVLESKLFNELFDLAWKKCENAEECKKAMDQHMAQYQTQFKESVVLERVIVADQLLTPLSKGEFVQVV